MNDDYIIVDVNLIISQKEKDDLSSQSLIRFVTLETKKDCTRFVLI